MRIVQLNGSDAMYRKKGTGNVVFRYKVLGTQDEIKEYKANLKKGNINCHESPDGDPLFFTTRYALDNSDLILGGDGQYFPSTAKLEAARSLTEQMGGDFGAVIGQALLGDAIGISSSSAAPAASDEVSSESTEAIDEH